jgi:hypothetical protein
MKPASTIVIAENEKTLCPPAARSKPGHLTAVMRPGPT